MRSPTKDVYADDKRGEPKDLSQMMTEVKHLPLVSGIGNSGTRDILFQLFFGGFENTLYLRNCKSMMKLMKKSILFLMMLLAAATLSAQDLVDRVSQAVGVELPSEYRLKVKDFVANDTIMRTRSATQFTEQFLKEQMKEDWGMSKMHQYLFMWSTVYEEITKKFLYDWLDDDDEVRSNDYENHLKTLIAFRENYKKEFKAYMEAGIAEADRRIVDAQRRSADADRRIADADRRIADADRRIEDADRRIEDAQRRIEDAQRRIEDAQRRSAEYDRQIAEEEQQLAESFKILMKQMVELYDLYIQNQDIIQEIIKKEELNSLIEPIKEYIEDCKKLNFDYKAILRKELGDEQKVKDLLKFYGIE